MRISRSLLNALALAHPASRRLPPPAPLLLLVTVDEGPGLRDMNGIWEHEPLTALLPQLLLEIGWKLVEHSVRRTLVLRIGRQNAEREDLTCDADRGCGFEVVEIFDALTLPQAVDLQENEAAHVDNA